MKPEGCAVGGPGSCGTSDADGGIGFGGRGRRTLRTGGSCAGSGSCGYATEAPPPLPSAPAVVYVTADAASPSGLRCAAPRGRGPAGGACCSTSRSKAAALSSTAVSGISAPRLREAVLATLRLRRRTVARRQHRTAELRRAPTMTPVDRVFPVNEALVDAATYTATGGKGLGDGGGGLAATTATGAA